MNIFISAIYFQLILTAVVPKQKGWKVESNIYDIMFKLQVFIKVVNYTV